MVSSAPNALTAPSDPNELHDVVDPAEHDTETSLPPASIDAEIAAKHDSEPEPGPKRIAVVFAHPDDAEFGVAGTVARWVNEGHTLIYISLTSGGQGGEDPNVTSEDLEKSGRPSSSPPAKSWA